jgi:hypothetical protein
MLVREAKFLKNSEQIVKSAIDTAENLNRGPHTQQARLFYNDLRCFLAQSHDFFLFEGEKRRTQRFLLVEAEQGLNDRFCQL